MKRYLLVVLLGMTGCAGRMALLRNPKTGEMARCEVTAGEAFMTGAINSRMTFNNCIRAYEDAGFERMRKENR